MLHLLQTQVQACQKALADLDEHLGQLARARGQNASRLSVVLSKLLQDLDKIAEKEIGPPRPAKSGA